MARQRRQAANPPPDAAAKGTETEPDTTKPSHEQPSVPSSEALGGAADEPGIPEAAGGARQAADAEAPQQPQVASPGEESAASADPSTGSSGEPVTQSRTETTVRQACGVSWNLRSVSPVHIGAVGRSHQRKHPTRMRGSQSHRRNRLLAGMWGWFCSGPRYPAHRFRMNVVALMARTTALAHAAMAVGPSARVSSASPLITECGYRPSHWCG